MTEYLRHTCRGRQCVIFVEDGIYYQFWSRDRTVYLYDSGPHLTTASCGVCKEVYQMVRMHRHSQALTIHSWEGLLANPVPTIMRMAL
jgi:hypothetical protein